jgi:glutamate N-acetyltransferase/amino-acid N-acetyltransferase
MLECDQNEVFLASTGTIGLPLQEALISGALPEAVKGLSPDGVDAASRAILTTDIGPKVALKTFKWHGRTGMVTGVAKGAGMIHPDMATMLVFIMTDAPAGPEFLKSALKAAVDKSFHSISVDGDTSTNDTVLLMASGRLAGPEMKSVSEASGFMKALTDVCRSLAWMVVRDGEGAERVMEISVKGARSDREASRAAHAVATSPLVKTALHGGDPNWGRILAAVGRSGARFSAGRVSLKVGDLVLVENGEPAIYREEKAARIFSRERVPVSIDLGAGSCKAFLMTCDLGHDYVTLNADYRT